jgi:hypothetical protein
MDPVLVAETVRTVMAEAGLKKPTVLAAVGGHDVIVKKIPMDRMSQNDAREVIRWEAEQHVPFDMENVQLDFQVLDPDGDTPQMAVLLVAAKRELIDNRLSLIADAGIEPAGHGRGSVRPAQRVRAQLPGCPRRHGGGGQHRPRDVQREPDPERHAGADPGRAVRHAPPA